MKITPGTWDYELTEIDSGNPQRPWQGPQVVYATWANDESVTVCTLEKTPEMHANARLIAAAPELLTALQKIVDQEQHDDNAEAHMHDMADIARAVLKAATGESK